MHVHILGICGTFMGSVALLARDSGYTVSGSDEKVYPPMSTQLAEQGIALSEGYHPEHLVGADLVVVGNAMVRGNPVVEHLLNGNTPYTSGPQFLADSILKDRWVLAVSGTHGKTTASAMLAWILEYAGLAPGFLIGGIPANFSLSARLGDSPFFVVEADEYDTAFFDKRSKFVHYRPRTAIVNNLEFDHADIFDSLGDIQQQFHQLIRTVPSNGLIVVPDQYQAVDEVLAMGCWSDVVRLGREWQAVADNSGAGSFEIVHNGKVVGTVNWSLTGEHNRANALASVVAARHAGVLPEVACEALSHFQGVKRRMELIGTVRGINVYDDFAHHPTAIATTLEGLRDKLPEARICAIIEPRSNTMKMGVHGQALRESAQSASEVIWYRPDGLAWSMDEWSGDGYGAVKTQVMASTEAIIDYLVNSSVEGDELVIMSNGGFEGIHQRLLSALSAGENRQ